MHTVPYVTRHGYHYELSREPRSEAPPSAEFCWDLTDHYWVRDEYAMLLAKDYMRQHRDQLLRDALDVLDRHDKQVKYGIAPSLSEWEIRQVAVYAQDLRDVPQQVGFPSTILWPTPPKGLNRDKHEDHLKIAV